MIISLKEFAQRKFQNAVLIKAERSAVFSFPGVVKSMKDTSVGSYGYFRVLAYVSVMFAAVSNSSLQEKNDFQNTVEATYKKVVSCLRLGGTLNGQYPLRYSDDLEEHYWEMINATAPYRGLQPHQGSGSYQGVFFYLSYL